MPRWLLVLIAVLLPLQLAWASVADYCGDAHDATAVHAAHHHAADDGTDLDGNDAPVPDCGHCHGHLTALPVSLDVGSAFMTRFESEPLSALFVVSRPAPRPERPQWQPLA